MLDRTFMDLDPLSCARLLRSFTTQDSLLQGKQIHLRLLKSGLHSSLFYANCLLQMYARCEPAADDAHQLFDEMPQRNCFSWNTLIQTHFKSGDYETSLALFESMPCKDEFSWDTIISGLSKSGNLDVARRLFNEMPFQSPCAWNSMIHGYVHHGRCFEALRLFKCLRWVEPVLVDRFILATVVGACASVADLDIGKQVHTHIVVGNSEFDSVLGSSLVNMYSKGGDFDCAIRVLDSMDEPDEFSLSAIISGYANSGRLIDARRVFDRRTSPTVVLWNSMISAYICNDRGEEALRLFNEMKMAGTSPDSTTCASALNACTSIGMLKSGNQIHAHVYKMGFLHDIIVGSTLIDMYSKCGRSQTACKIFDELEKYDTILLNSMITAYFDCGRTEDARRIFETMPYRSLITWNSMIVGYCQNGYAIEALKLFCEMNRLDLKIDKVSLASIISICARTCSLGLGEQLLARSTIIGLESDMIIGSSLIDLYCKCGSAEEGRRLFHKITKSDEIPWNSMLMGFSQNGYGSEALQLFDEMRLAGINPNGITFIAVLSGCSHCGLVEEGRRWFDVMKEDYGIVPEVEHYSCMIDLFARAGCLEEAVDFINKMPFKADASMWSSLLSACKAFGDESLGRKVAERLIKLDPENSGAYVQLSSIYAACGKWEKSAQVRKMMQERRLRKLPGYSWNVIE